MTHEKLAELDIAEQDLATLTDNGVTTIAARIEAAFHHEEFWDKRMLQVLQFYKEQVLQDKDL